MSITITGEFDHPYQAQQAAQRLRRRGYTVSQRQAVKDRTPPGNLLVAYPFGMAGGNTFGNNLMGSLPPMAGNGVMVTRKESMVLSVLTDDTQAADAKRLLEAMGGRILQA